MSRALPLALAAALVLAGVLAPTAGGVAPPRPEATAPAPGVSADTTAVLALDDVGRSTFASPGLSVTSAVAGDASALESRFDAYAVEERYRAATSEDAKRQILRNATAALRDRANALRARERAARTAYRADEISATAYVTTLGELDAAANGVEAALDRIAALPNGGSAVESRIRHIRAELATLQGPARDRIDAAVRGDRAAATDRLYVATAESGTVLAYVDEDDGVYVREGVRNDNLDGVGDAVDIDTAREHFNSVYPWASNGSHWRRFSIGFFGPDAYLLQIEHGHGSLTSYLDASTNRVYREVQTKTLSSLPVDTEYSTADGDVTMWVSDTYAGGPLRVRATNDTGAPLDAAVAINGTAVGRTGDDGVLWTVSPDGTYPVEVTRGATTVEMNATAARTQ